ncbi:hypothetical protein [Lacticaseibacillus daqingensis]|uniref:hypothetical protein n=1 Tax=Lacticaseibacillus daqingensis TaxID=2486014 RepID=UPI000F78901C|nr:hypothetical protein [Lacticaseibacillus daqingensis]
MPHGIFGLSWGELVAVGTLIGLIYTGLYRLLKSFGDKIAAPLSQQLSLLSKAIDDLSKNSLTEHHNIDKRLDKHDVRLGQHDVEIGTLYSTVGLTRRKKEERN